MARTTTKTADIFPLIEGAELIPNAWMFPLSRVVPMEQQPRDEVDAQKRADVMASIKALRSKSKGIGGTGIREALKGHWEPGAFNFDGTVKPDARVIVTAGENRYWGAVADNLTHIPIIIESQSSDDAYEEAAESNLLRGDMSAVDEGRYFAYLKAKYNLTIDGVAKRVYGTIQRSGYVQNRIDLIGVDADVLPVVSRSPKSMSVARRINQIREPGLRKKLIAMALSGATFDEVNKAIKAARLAPSPPATAASNGWHGSTKPMVFGSPRAKGLATHAAFNLDDAMDAITRQAEATVREARHATLRSETRKRLAHKAQKNVALLEQLIEVLSKSAK